MHPTPMMTVHKSLTRFKGAQKPYVRMDHFSGADQTLVVEKKIIWQIRNSSRTKIEDAVEALHFPLKSAPGLERRNQKADQRNRKEQDSRIHRSKRTRFSAHTSHEIGLAERPRLRTLAESARFRHSTPINSFGSGVSAVSSLRPRRD